MKLQTKKLFAFTIIMLLFSTIVNAQCSGNKVPVHRVTRHCASMCVSPSKVRGYLSQGWQIGPCTCCGYVLSNNKIENKKIMNKTLVNSSANNDVAFQYSYFCRCSYRDYGCTGIYKRACVAYCGPRCGHVDNIQKISFKNTSPYLAFHIKFAPITILQSDNYLSKFFESKRDFINLPANSKIQFIHEMEWGALNENDLNN